MAKFTEKYGDLISVALHVTFALVVVVGSIFYIADARESIIANKAAIAKSKAAIEKHRSNSKTIGDLDYECTDRKV